MSSPDGGWGPTAKAKESQSDVTALGVFVYRSALLEDVKFTDEKEREKVRKVENDIAFTNSSRTARARVRAPVSWIQNNDVGTID